MGLMLFWLILATVLLQACGPAAVHQWKSRDVLYVHSQDTSKLIVKQFLHSNPVNSRYPYIPDEGSRIRIVFKDLEKEGVYAVNIDTLNPSIWIRLNPFFSNTSSGLKMSELEDMFEAYGSDSAWGFNELSLSSAKKEPLRAKDSTIAVHVVPGVYLAVVLTENRKCVLRTYSTDFELLGKIELNNDQKGAHYSNSKYSKFQSPTRFTVVEHYKTSNIDVREVPNEANTSEVVFTSNYYINSLGRIEAQNKTPFSKIEILASGSCN